MTSCFSMRVPALAVSPLFLILITQTENEFISTTNEEYQALSIVVGTISPWTGEEIIPCEFTKTDNTFNFKYYDGYVVPFSRWSYGWATLYLDNEAIEWGAHTL
ncbi:hypothetical protein ES703_09219 [subsurface metagenome]